ncbi:EAL domain-containing protein [Enterobacteriaceae bacterium RIT691]|nr:EAL domain-containing protein [Enterobacteriaceae bacterium RIT691]
MQKTLKRYPLSFVTTLIVLLVACSATLVMSIYLLQKQSSRELLADTTEKMQDEKSQYISHRIEMYLNEPRLAGGLISHLADATGSLSSPAVAQELRHVLAEDFPGNQSISRMGIATASGQYMAFQKKPNSTDLMLINTSADEHQLIVHETEFADSPAVKTLANYNLFGRPWYIQGMTQRSPFWSSSYYHRLTENASVMSWRLPYYQKDTHFAGIIFADINPDVLSDCLKKLLPTPDSRMLIVDKQQRIIAASADKYRELKRSVANPEALVQPEASAYPDLKPFLPVVGQQFLTPQKIQYQGHDYFVRMKPIEDKSHQLNWTLMIVTPDAVVSNTLLKMHLKEVVILAALILLSLLAVIMLIRQFFLPFNQLVHKTRYLGQRPWSHPQNLRVYPEIALLDRELNSASGFIADLLQEHKVRLNNDPETGMLTRTGLFNAMPGTDNRNLLLMVRLTNFRDMRSTLGHSYSQKFIGHFSHKLTELAPANTLMCRYSEDLFVIVLPGVNEQKDLDTYWGLLSSLFNDSVEQDDAEVTGENTYIYTGQAGGVLAPISTDNLSECMMNAALALNQSRPGVNRECVLFTTEMRENELNNVQMHQALLDDLRNEGFHLVMQPIVNLDNPQTFNEGECLIRWQSSVLGFVPPDKFIGLAERTGLIIALGRWIIEDACRELAEFIARGAPVDFKLHINISAVQLQQSDFTEHLLTSIQANGLMNKNICLEITESVLLQDAVQVIECLNYLRRLGLSVAIDDFGSGYSSLSYLHQLPFDCLKIDRGFVSGILEDKKSEAVISSVIMISQQFGVPLVAEGVETADMGNKLRKMGCSKSQGYYYARPQLFSAWHPENGVVPLST